MTVRVESAPRTLYDKLVDAHTVRPLDDEAREVLLYVDRTVLNEYTSPQAFTGLREAGRPVVHPEAALAVVDHVNSTEPGRAEDRNAASRDIQMAYFARNCADYGIELFDLFHSQQGIEHVVMPELGLVLPGMVIAAGDSHTTTYGAFGALGFGIGTSDIEHMLATQTLVYRRLRNMKIEVTGDLPLGVTAKDLIMAVISKIGASGANGFAIEFAGSTIEAMSMEGRMTVCNMAIEGGARAGLIAPDDKTFEYCKGRPHAPKGAQWEAAMDWWKTLYSDDDAHWDKVITIKGEDIAPAVTWGTSPEDVLPITAKVPAASDFTGGKVDAAKRAIEYMGLTEGMALTDIEIDTVFIGSCTNGRIEDLRAAAAVLKGKKIKEGMRAMIVPGSGLVRAQAEEEGLADIFKDAGFEWRLAGCSMCLAMNPDQLAPGERCASTSNRNFEGRQGFKGRTHLMSPAMAAAAALTGRLTDIRQLDA